MSCQFCEDKDPLPSGGCGWFQITTERYHKMDGSMIVNPIIRFSASDSVFDQEIEVEDYARIKFCPMCGKRLGVDK